MKQVYEIIWSQEIIENIKSVNDPKLSSAVTQRLERVKNGNFGDTKSLGNGVHELRIHYGEGYRIYYTIRGSKIVFLLCAGSKSNQKHAIKKAKELVKEV